MSSNMHCIIFATLVILAMKESVAEQKGILCYLCGPDSGNKITAPQCTNFYKPGIDNAIKNGKGLVDCEKSYCVSVWLRNTTRTIRGCAKDFSDLDEVCKGSSCRYCSQEKCNDTVFRIQDIVSDCNKID